jgi:hypothetical protein
MSKLHIGPHTHDEKVDSGQTFDREINVKAIGWTIGILVAVTVVVHVIIYGLIVGFNRYDEKREPQRSPIAEANPQVEPPKPWLQTTPEGELKLYRENEDRLLGQAQWVDQSQGTLQIPIDLAMEIVATRGLGPEVVGGTAQPQAAAATPPPAQESR